MVKSPAAVSSLVRSPATWVGLAGSSLLAVGEVRRLVASNRAVTGSWTTWLAGTVPANQAVVLSATGIALLTLAWLVARPQGGSGPRPGLLFAVWVVPLLVLPPVLSTDAGSYADLGWMVAHGSNPYDVGLGTTGSPFAYGRAWRGTTSVYPPLSLALFGAVVHLSGAHWYWSVVALRALPQAGAVLLLWAVPRLARAQHLPASTAVWFAVLNPITLVHGVAGSHVDLLMAGLVVTGLAVARTTRGGWVAGAVLVGLAASIKQPALLAVPAVAGLWLLGRAWSWWRSVAVHAGGAGIALGTFWLTGPLTGLGHGWVTGTGNPARSATPTLAYVVSSVTGWSSATLTTGLQVTAAVIAGWALLRWWRSDPLRFVGIAAMAWALGFGTFREWYLVLPLALVGLARPGLARGAVVALTVPTFAVYGLFREYLRWPILTSLEAAACLGIGLLAVGSLLARWLPPRPKAAPAVDSPAGAPALPPSPSADVVTGAASHRVGVRVSD